MKHSRMIAFGKSQSPAPLTYQRRRPERNGLGIWILILCSVIALLVMNRQDHLNQNTTPAQENAFRQEQARRLTALGIGPVITEGVAYAEK